MKTECTYCGSSRARKLTETVEIPYRDSVLEVEGVPYTHCSACGEDTVDYTQAKLGEKLIADAKRVHDNLLTCGEIREMRESWGLTQVEASEIFGGGANSFSKYERGEVSPSAAMNLLIKLYDRFPVIRPYVRDPSD